MTFIWQKYVVQTLQASVLACPSVVSSRVTLFLMRMKAEDFAKYRQKAELGNVIETVMV